MLDATGPLCSETRGSVMQGFLGGVVVLLGQCLVVDGGLVASFSTIIRVVLDEMDDGGSAFPCRKS